MSGRRRRGRPIDHGGSQRPTLVVAGLPLDVFPQVVARLQTRFPERTILGTPSRKDGPLYPGPLVEELVEKVAAFAVRRRRNGGTKPASPKSITLLYVPGQDQESLLQAFDFAVLSYPLAALAAYGEAGRQLRHEPDAAMTTILDALGPEGPAKLALDEILQRTARLAESDALLLPPENFHVGDDRMRRLLLEFSRGQRDPTDRFPELEPVRLTAADIARLGKDVRHCHVDERDIAFLNAHPTAYDGSQWEREEGATAEELTLVLRSLYRFGGPLPSGFHHDAQRADGKRLHQVEFECSQAGRRTISGTHANVFPNDFVRPGKLRRKK